MGIPASLAVSSNFGYLHRSGYTELYSAFMRHPMSHIHYKTLTLN
jgi:hypothetical protein